MTIENSAMSPVNWGRRNARVGETARRSGVGSLGFAEAALLVAAIGAIVAVALGVSVFLAAPLYAVFFVALCLGRPRLAILLMLASAPLLYDVGLGPVNLSAADLSLILAVLSLTFVAKRVSLHSPFWYAAILYLAVCLLSTIANNFESGDVVAFVQMVVYLLVATFAFSQLFQDPASLKLGLMGLVCVDGVLSIIVVLSGTSYAAGLHKNAMGAQTCLGVLCAAALWWSSTGRARWLALAGLMLTSCGLLLSLSRGAWVGTMFGGLIMLVLFRAWRQAAQLALLAVPVLAIAWLSLPEAQREYATDVSQGRNIQARYANAESAMSAFRSSPLLGVGVGFRKRSDATNLLIFTLAETGVVGLAAFLILIGTFSYMVYTTWKRMDRDDPYFPLLVLGAGLMAAKFGHAMFDHYWQRGMLPIWAGAGMVIRASQEVRRQRRAGRVARVMPPATTTPLWAGAPSSVQRQ